MAKKLFLQIRHRAIEQGVLSALGPTNFHTLIGLAYFMNDKGECYPSEEILMLRLGLHDISSVSNRITKLAKTYWKGKPAITIKRKDRVKTNDGKYKWGNNHYKINKEIVSIFSSWSNGQMED